jgi:hypothetical protein
MTESPIQRQALEEDRGRHVEPTAGVSQGILERVAPDIVLAGPP